MLTSLVWPLLTAAITGLCRTSAIASQLQLCSAIDQMIYRLISVLNILTTNSHHISYVWLFFVWLEYDLFLNQWNHLLFLIISSIIWQDYIRASEGSLKNIGELSAQFVRDRMCISCWIHMLTTTHLFFLIGKRLTCEKTAICMCSGSF